MIDMENNKKKVLCRPKGEGWWTGDLRVAPSCSAFGGRHGKQTIRIKTKRDERRGPATLGWWVSPFLTNRLGLSKGGRLCTSATARRCPRIFGCVGGDGWRSDVGAVSCGTKGRRSPSLFDLGGSRWAASCGRRGWVLGGFSFPLTWGRGGCRAPLVVPVTHGSRDFTAEHHPYSQVGISAGAAHLFKDNAGVLRAAHGGWKPPVESKVKSLCSDLDSQ